MTQKEQILEYMKKYGSITALDAMRDIGCMRLAARISDLRTDGHLIESDMIKVANREGDFTTIARYKLLKDITKEAKEKHYAEEYA